MNNFRGFAIIHKEIMEKYAEKHSIKFKFNTVPQHEEIMVSLKGTKIQDYVCRLRFQAPQRGKEMEDPNYR